MCVICRAPFASEDNVSIVSRHKETLTDFSCNYGDTELVNYLHSNPKIVRVHNECRRNYTSRHRLQQLIKRPNNDSETEAVQSKSLRSSSVSFDWKLQCFFAVSCVLKMIGILTVLITELFRH